MWFVCFSCIRIGQVIHHWATTRKNGLTEEDWRYATINCPFFSHVNNPNVHRWNYSDKCQHSRDPDWCFHFHCYAYLTSDAHKATWQQWQNVDTEWSMSASEQDGELWCASQKLSVIWNHWWPSHNEPLWCRNKRGFDKSHVQLAWSPTMRPKTMACCTIFTKTRFLV